MRHGAIVGAALTVGLCCPEAAHAQGSLPRFINVRDGTPPADHFVTVTFAAGQASGYNNGTTCPAIHTTAMGNRAYAHLHIGLSLPITGIDEAGNMHACTDANSNAYWDNQYGPTYTRSGASDLTYNCWGFAIEPKAPPLLQCWINDASYIYTDDYNGPIAVPGPTPSNTVIRRQTGGTDTHVIYISQTAADGGTAPAVFYITQTIEKNRTSAIYTKNYPATAHYTETNIYKRKY